MPGYGYSLGDEAVHAFATLPIRQREKLLRAFGQLARAPGQAGDYRESGATGRIYEIKLLDEHLVTWWTDHATREIRIVRLERVE